MSSWLSPATSHNDGAVDDNDDGAVDGNDDVSFLVNMLLLHV